jgi:hypothetical protein
MLAAEHRRLEVAACENLRFSTIAGFHAHGRGVKVAGQSTQ